MDEFEPITPLQIYEAIDKINDSSGKTMEVTKKNAVSVLLYKEILKFSKEELENIMFQGVRKVSLYYPVLNRSEPLLFAGLLKKGAYCDKLNTYSQWIVKNIENIPLEVYEVIYNTEKQIKLKKEYPDRFDYLTENYPTNHLINGLVSYIEKNPNDFSENLFNSFYNEFHDSLHSIFLNCIKDNSLVYPKTIESLINKMHEYNHDINEDFIVNKLFCSELDVWKRKNEKFVLEKHTLPKVDNLLKIGFSIDPNYTFNGENLLTAILKGQHAETINILIPHVEINPNFNNIEEQKLLIETLKDKPFYNDIKSTYLKGLFDHIVPKIENKNITNGKIKI